jgi:hypothetical protein
MSTVKVLFILQSAGNYKAEFNGEGLASGLYYARLTASDHTQTIKMSLLK